MIDSISTPGTLAHRGLPEQTVQRVKLRLAEAVEVLTSIAKDESDGSLRVSHLEKQAGGQQCFRVLRRP